LRARGFSKPSTMDWNKLYYVSGHTLNGEMVCNYGKQRILSNSISMWLAKQLSPNGITFDDTATNVSESEITNLPNGKAYVSVDAVSWEVLVRSGDEMLIHPDHSSRWQKEPPEFADKFKDLHKQHALHYKDLLAPVIKMQRKSTGPAHPESGEQVVEVDDEGEEDEAASNRGGVDPPEEWDSLDALKAQVNICETLTAKEPDIKILGDEEGIKALKTF
jgi:hypothetical protein